MTRHTTMKERREPIRQRMLDKVPEWYRSWMHAGATMFFCTSLLGVAFVYAKFASGWQLLAAIPMAVFLNVFEWAFHRFVMHDKHIWPWIHRSHTKEHHAMFFAEDMGIDDPHAAFYTLIPAPTIAGFVVLASIYGLLTGAVLGGPYGWLMTGTCGAYVMLYELSHTVYHLPDTHWVRKSALVRWLAEQHTRHHEPKLMSRWNFNITVPLADWLFGTLVSKRGYEGILEERRRKLMGGGREVSDFSAEKIAEHDARTVVRAKQLLQGPSLMGTLRGIARTVKALGRSRAVA